MRRGVRADDSETRACLLYLLEGAIRAALALGQPDTQQRIARVPALRALAAAEKALRSLFGVQPVTTSASAPAFMAASAMALSLTPTLTITADGRAFDTLA